MDETTNSILPEPENQSGRINLSAAAGKAKNILSELNENKRRAVATGLAAAAIGSGTMAGVELSRSPGPEVGADVPYQKYGKDSYPQPIKIAQHLLWQAKNADPNKNKVISDHIWTGVIVLPPGTVLYQAPDEAFPSAGSRQKIDIGKFVGPKDEPVVIELPRMLAFGDGQVYIVANLKSDKKMENRATDPEENYWYPVEKAQAEGAKFMTYENLPPSLGAVTIDADNNLKFGTFRPNQVAIMETIKQDLLEKKVAAGEMVATLPTAGR